MGEIYFQGIYRTYSIAGVMVGKISENHVDGIKESITRYCETKINDLPLSEQEKEERKHQMKQSADAYNQGIKDGLRMVGKLITVHG